MTTITAVIDSGTGNLRSALKALQVSAPDHASVVLTDDPAIVRSAHRIVLPGVGSFGACAAGIDRLRDVLIERAASGVPILGICVGMQLLADTGEEYGFHAGLGLIPGTVRHLPDHGQRLPHMGWNALQIEATAADGTPFAAISEGTHMYFVHSYHFDALDPRYIAARSVCGISFAAAVRRDNVCGVQFHPEKSGTDGLAFLAAFQQWQP